MIFKNIQGLTSISFRLKPGQDLKQELQRVTTEHRLKAAAILSGVGSLSTATLRLAQGKTTQTRKGPFEIVSLTGTLCQDGLHLHISLADCEGATWGGHLMDGCHIHTTAEIVLLDQNGLQFSRPTDEATGFKELSITHSASIG
jgi:predicted DNA-binding protein with PD1-like motif